MVSSWEEGDASHISVQQPHKNVHSKPPPARAVRLEVLKRLETEFQKRRIVPDSNTQLLHPLWFLAETERNVFLWRRKLSISAADNFDFWVDVQALITKRLNQLEQTQSGNPFHQASWLDIPQDDALIGNEREYLLSVRALVSKIDQHIAVLCMLGDYIRSISNTQAPQQEKEVVLLPAGFVVN